ncbi:MAG: glycosyltransferase family 4 protein [Acidobacteriota bacterium]
MTDLHLDFLSPLPPVRSGISDYSVDLLPYLQARCDVRVVRLPDQPIAALIEARFAPVPFARLGEDGRLPLYQMGNNRYHEGVREAALRLPGVLTLHDVVLHHLLLDQTIGHGRWEPYAAELRRDHGWIGAAVAGGARWGLHGHAAQFALFANRSLLRRQRGVVVHSDWAAEALAEQDPELRVRVVPMAVPLPPAADAAAGREFRARHGLAPGPLLGSFGFQTPIKRTSTAVRALARPELRDTHLLIVGEVAPALELDREAAELGVAERVHVFGYLPFAEFTAAIAACDLCLNLRYPSAGETSASLLRVLAMGRPCVVSDYAQFAELPDAIVAKVPLGEGEVEAFAATAAELLGEPARRAAMGESARQHVRREHDPERAAERLLAACAELAAAAPLPERDVTVPPSTSLVASQLAARLEVSGAEAPWPAGERRRLRVRLRNTGTQRLLSAAHRDGGLALQVSLLDGRDRDLLAGRPWLPVTRDLDPGASFDAELVVRRPPGRARLRVEPRLTGRDGLEVDWEGGVAWDSAL